MEQYVFEDSVGRINKTMTYSTPLVQDSIPDEDETSEMQPCFVNATVVYIVMNTTSESPQVMQSFITEASKIARAHENCKDVICFEDRMMLIYSTAFKAELENAFDDAARIRSLSMVVSKLGSKNGLGSIKVNIGMAFGVVEMYKISQDSTGNSRYAWRGKAINNARENADEASDEIVITRVVWNNLSERNQKLFPIPSALTENYRGQIVNVMMNNWVNKAL